MSFFNNSFWGAISAILRMSLSVFTTIIAIQLLGDEAYGYVVVINTVTVLWLILNNGFYTVLVRRIVYVYVEDTSKIYEFISLGLIYTIISASLLVLVGLLVEEDLLQLLFHGSNRDILKSDLLIAYEYAVLIIVVRLFVLYSLSLFEGVGKFSTAAKIQLLSPLLQFFGLLLMPSLSPGGLTIKILFLIYLASATFELMVTVVLLLIREWPKRTKGFVATEMVRQFLVLVGESVKLQVSNILSMFVDPLNKLLINHFIGVSQVTSYELVVKIVMAVRGVFSATFRAFLQLAPNKGIAANQYKKVLGYIFIPSIILYMIVLLLFVTMVNGKVLNVSTSSIYLMFIVLIPSIVIVLVAPLYSLLIGFGEFKYILILHARLAIINSVFTLALVPLVGIIGAGVGLSIATIYNGYSVFNRFTKKHEGLGSVRSLITYKGSDVWWLTFVFVATSFMLWIFDGGNRFAYFGSAATGLSVLLWRLWKAPLTSMVLQNALQLGHRVTKSY